MLPRPGTPSSVEYQEDESDADDDDDDDDDDDADDDDECKPFAEVEAAWFRSTR